MIAVVGMGADGWEGMAPAAREIVCSARTLVAAPRHAALVEGNHDAHVIDLPKPLRPGLAALADEPGPVVVLASGDPLHYGIGRALVEVLGAAAVRVLPAVSSMQLACARLGWAVEATEVVSLVGRPAARLLPALQDGVRLLVLVPDASGAALVAESLCANGFQASMLHVLTDLGAAAEGLASARADSWTGPAASDLAIVAVECVGAGLPLTSGLPDAAYETDGQLTKQHVRAATLAALGPRPGELLWDVGGGSGSIGIEWLRTHPTTRAAAVESNPVRAQRISRNGERLAGGRLDVVEGRAPSALAGLPTPDAVFVGGGLTEPGLLETVLAALRPGGRLVANTVTLDSEALLFEHFRRLGGTLTRLEVSHADAVGSFTSWSAARPVTQWSWTKPLGTEPLGGEQK